LGEELGFFEGALALLAAFGLERFELLQVSLHVAADALLVGGQELELIRLRLERARVREGDLELAALALVAEREHVVLDGAGAVQTPVVLGNGVSELLFHGRFGFEAVDDPAAEAVVRFAVFGGEDVDLASEAVTEAELAFPAGVLGPVERSAFRRLAATCFSEIGAFSKIGVFSEIIGIKFPSWHAVEHGKSGLGRLGPVRR
jgi:hypothetical protein